MSCQWIILGVPVVCLNFEPFILNPANIPKELSRISIKLSYNFTLPLSCGHPPKKSNGLKPFKFGYICYSENASLIILRHIIFCQVSHISSDTYGNLFIRRILLDTSKLCLTFNNLALLASKKCNHVNKLATAHPTGYGTIP